MPIVFASYVLINIPAGYLLAFPAGLGAEGLILGLIAGLTCCAVLTIRRLRRDMVSLEKTHSIILDEDHLTDTRTSYEQGFGTKECRILADM